MSIKDYFSIFIPCLAFSIALYTFLANNPRFREFGKKFGVFTAMQLIAMLFCSTLLLTLQLKENLSSSTNILNNIEVAECILTYASIAFFIYSWLYLCHVFYQIFGSLYFMRKKRFLKYTHIITKIYEIFFFKEQYETSYRKRTIINMNCLPGINFSDLSEGGSILVLYADGSSDCISLIKNYIIETIASNETIDFIATIKQPLGVLDCISNNVNDDQLMKISKKMSIIDCYSSYYAFDDKVLSVQKKRWINKGFKFFNAESFAGIHTAANSSWYRFRTQCKAEENQFRIPHRTIFHTLSSLIRYSSEEQFFLYLRHIISSEKSYGMITLLIEPMSLKAEIKNELYQMVDYIVEMKDCSFEIKKGSSHTQPQVGKPTSPVETSH
jgi:hypothetical protein